MSAMSPILGFLLAFAFTMNASAQVPVYKVKDAVKGEYIVVTKDQPDLKNISQYRITLAAQEQKLMSLASVAEAAGGEVFHLYTYAFLGFHGRFSNKAIQALRKDNRVKYIEEVGKVTVSPIHFDQYSTLATPSWGIDRIDQRALPLDGVYSAGTFGEGTHGYIVDTGIYPDHQEFAGRLGNGFSSIPGDSSPNDCHGHGTHVAGTIGGTTVGVAPKATLHAVRVLDCNGGGTTQTVVDGINWVISNHVNPAVINMSLGGGFSQALNDATANAVRAGVVTVVAAGNSNIDACNTSPASEPLAITVGATTSSDDRALFSNWGSCLDIFAPGQGIYSSWLGGSASYASLSGTSMATPHVVGGALLYRGTNPNATADDVVSILKKVATPNLPTNAGANSPALLLYVKDFVTSGLVVDAGPDIEQNGSNRVVTLNGKVSSSSGEIVSVQWEQVSGPKNNNVQLQGSLNTQLVLRDLEAGVYQFVLRASDSKGQSGEDSVKVTITSSTNQPPQAVIESGATKVNPNTYLNLNGSKSIDPDGTIASYSWQFVRGPGGLNFQSPTGATTGVLGNIPGEYVIRLVVTDNQGATGSAEFSFRINASPVVAPIPPQTITLPTSSVTLTANATDPEGGPIRIIWAVVSGNPTNVTFTPVNANTVTVSGMTSPGLYRVAPIAYDDLNGYGYTIVDINVLPAPAQASAYR